MAQELSRDDDQMVDDDQMIEWVPSDPSQWPDLVPLREGEDFWRDLTYYPDPDRRMAMEPGQGREFLERLADEAEKEIGLSEAESEERRLNFGPWARAKRAWDEMKVKRDLQGRFANKPSGPVDAIQRSNRGGPAPQGPRTAQGDAPKAPKKGDEAPGRVARKTEYDARKATLEKRAKKSVAKGTKKGEGPREGEKSGYLQETRDLGDRGKTGLLNQKALLRYVNEVASPTHRGANGRVVLDAPTTAVKYSQVRTTERGTEYRVWDRDRVEQVWEPIIEKFLRGGDLNNDYLPSQKQPKVLFTGGGYAAGKGTLLDTIFPDQGRIPEDSFTLDPDEVKKELPEFDALLDVDPEANLATYEEAWEIAQEIQRRAQQRKINMVVDGISNTSPEEMMARVESFVDAGYENPELVYVNISTEEAIKRSIARAENPKAPRSSRRYIPETIMRSVHRDVSATVPGIFDLVGNGDRARNLGLKVEVYDNESFSKPPTPELIAAAEAAGMDVSDYAKENGIPIGDKWTGWSYPERIAAIDPGGEVQIDRPEHWETFIAKGQERIEGVHESPVLGAAAAGPMVQRGMERVEDNTVGGLFREIAENSPDKFITYGKLFVKSLRESGVDPHQLARVSESIIETASRFMSEDQLRRSIELSEQEDEDDGPGL